MRRVILLGGLAMLPGCMLFEDLATRQYVGDQVIKAVADAANGDYLASASSGIASMIAAIWGVNTLRNRARRARGEPTGRAPSAP